MLVMQAVSASGQDVDDGMVVAVVALVLLLLLVGGMGW
jgi:hypothetical protein